MSDPSLLPLLRLYDCQWCGKEVGPLPECAYFHGKIVHRRCQRAARAASSMVHYITWITGIQQAHTGPCASKDTRNPVRHGG